jgi:hypothetical protein
VTPRGYYSITLVWVFYYIGLSQQRPASASLLATIARSSRPGPKSCSAKCSVRTRAEPELCAICAEDRPVRPHDFRPLTVARPPRLPVGPRPLCFACLPCAARRAVPGRVCAGHCTCAGDDRCMPQVCAAVSPPLSRPLMAGCRTSPITAPPRASPPVDPKAYLISHPLRSSQYYTVGTAGVPKQRSDGVVSFKVPPTSTYGRSTTLAPGPGLGGSALA